MSAPALRFNEFSGKREFKTLREISVLITKGTTPRTFTGKGINFIKIESFDGDTINPEKCASIDLLTHNHELKRSILAEGDILFAIAGATIGKCNIVNKEILPANTNQALAIIRLSNNESREFIYHILSSHKMRRYILNTVAAGAQPNLNLEQIGSFSFPYPHFTEQTKIANFLTIVDEKLAQLTRKHDLLTQYKKGVMQQIFSQELRFKDDNEREFPEWEERSLGEIASFIKDGTHGTHQDTVDGDYLLLSAKNIKNGGIYFDESDRRISKEEFNSIYKNYKLCDGDVLLSVVGTIGRVAIYSSAFSNVAFQRSVAFFRFEKESSLFIAQLFTATKFQNDLLTNQVVSAQAGIYLGDLAKIRINLPSLQEQTKIANFLTAIDEKITATKTQLAAMKQYKQGLLQQMFV